MPQVKVKKNLQLSTSKEAAHELGLKPGAVFDAAKKGNKIILTPAPERDAIETAIAEGLDDIKQGQVYGPFTSADEMIRSLHQQTTRRGVKQSKRS